MVMMTVMTKFGISNYRNIQRDTHGKQSSWGSKVKYRCGESELSPGSVLHGFERVNAIFLGTKVKVR